jgi:hypothetical protein
LLHYAGSDAHTDWKTWGPKTLKTVKLSTDNGPHGRDFIATHLMPFGMILRDLEIMKSQRVSCAYPYIPACLQGTTIADKDVKSILVWCTDIAKAITKVTPVIKIGPPKDVKRSVPPAVNRDGEPPVKQKQKLLVKVSLQQRGRH